MNSVISQKIISSCKVLLKLILLFNEFVYLKGKTVGVVWRDRVESSCICLFSLNGYKTQGWAMRMLGVKNLIQVSHMGTSG